MISEIMHKSNTVLLSDKLHSEHTQLYQPLSMPIEEITEYWDPFSMQYAHTHTHTQASMLLLYIPFGIFSFLFCLYPPN